MKKMLLIMVALLGGVFPSVEAQTVFSENFEGAVQGGMPDGWTLYGDGMGNHDTYASLPAEWFAYTSGADGGMAAFCISWKDVDGVASDRWMVTPAITIPAVAGCMLRFDSWGYNASYPEQFKVMVSTAGVGKEGFVEVYDIAAVPTEWTTHQVDLSAYAGQTVHVAFVSYGDGIYGCVDNVEVGIFAAHGIQLVGLDVPSDVVTGEAFGVGLTVRNTGTGTLTSFTVSYGTAGGMSVATFDGLSIAPFETYSGEVDLSIAATGQHLVTLTVSAPNGMTDDDITDNTASTYVYVHVAAGYDRTLLVEDFETAQTSYTPDAEARLAEGLAGYEDRVVHMTHHAGYYTDELTATVSEEMLNLYGTSMTWCPAMTIDRTQGLVADNEADGVVGVVGQTDAIASQVEAALARMAFVELTPTVTAYNPATRELAVRVGLQFAAPEEMEGVMMNVYIVEDSIVMAQNGSGETITDYVHNNVVRTALTSTWGDALIQSATAGWVDYTTTLPEGWQAGHCRVVVFASRDGGSALYRQVLNAAQTGYVTDAPATEPQTFVATIDNPDGGYIYYTVNDADGNSLQANRAYRGTTRVEYELGQQLCVDFGDINPLRQRTVALTEGANMVEAVYMNGTQVVFDSDNTLDNWDDYGYRLYSVCGTYSDDVAFAASFQPYEYTEADTASANLVVVNRSNAYVRQYVPGEGQKHIANTQYYTLEQGEEFVICFGIFDPSYDDWGVPDSAMRLLHLYIDGEDIDFDNPETPGISIFPHTDEGYTFYNYTYVQDGAKHRIEFVYGPYEDTVSCLPATMPVVQTGVGYAYLQWMPSPSAQYYTVVVDGEVLYDNYVGSSVRIEGLQSGTEYTVLIVTHCHNGGLDTLTYGFAMPVPAQFQLTTGGGYVYSYQWDIELEEGVYDFDGPEGEVSQFWIQDMSREYAEENGFDITTCALKAIYVDGQQVSLDSVGQYVTAIYQDEGMVAYILTVSYGQVDSVRVVFGPDAAGVECQAVRNLESYNWTNEGFSVYWDAPEGVSDATYEVTLMQGNEVLEQTYVEGTEGWGSYTFSGLEQETVYRVVVAMLCDGNPLADTLLVITSGDPHTLTIVNEGGGYLRNYYNNAQYDGTSYINAYAGQMTSLVMATFDHDTNLSVGYVDEDAEVLQHLYVDGVELDLGQADTSHSFYSLQVYDRMEGYGYVMYVLYIDFEEDHTVYAIFGPNQTASYVVTVASNDETLGLVVGGGTYSADSTAMVFALPQGGVTFVGWGQNSVANIVSSDNPALFTVAGNMNLYGVFAECNGETVTLHDTVTVTETVHDTVTVTETVHDTVTVTETETVHDTVTVSETVTVRDTVTVTDTLMLSDTVTMMVYDTVYIYVHDTVYVGVDEVELTLPVKLYNDGGRIVVEGAQGYDVVLFDAVGRRLDARHDDFGHLRFEVPASGTYLVRVGHYPARRIVVIK